MKKLGGISRRELFERVERGALRALPSDAYECAEWLERTVNTDYHVEVDKHWYSVPYELSHETVWARFTATTVEILHNRAKANRAAPRQIELSKMSHERPSAEWLARRAPQRRGERGEKQEAGGRERAAWILGAGCAQRSPTPGRRGRLSA
jgi:hypothetical protein